MPLEPKIAVVTGGGGTLADSIGRALSEAGYDARLPGRNDLDVARTDSVDPYFAQLEGLDLLVCNAGSSSDAPLPRVAERDWDDAMQSNLHGAARCARQAARRMARQRSGLIVFIGSHSGLHGNAGQTAYAAAKAGLHGLTLAMARELGKRNVRVHCILPGFLDTKMTRSLPEPVRAKALADHALGRLNTCDDVARFIVFLDTLENTSGQLFQLDSRPSRWC